MTRTEGELQSTTWFSRIRAFLFREPKPVVYRERTPAERAGESSLDQMIQCEQAFRDLGEDAGLCSCGRHDGTEAF